MSNLWVDIEALVLDGVPINSVEGRRLAEMTEIALTRLLDQRGTPVRLTSVRLGDKQPTSNIKLPATANEGRWAEELALVLYRAMDRNA